MEEIILETKELCKQYHKQTVLKNINMRIPKGCVYGLFPLYKRHGTGGGGYWNWNRPGRSSAYF